MRATVNINACYHVFVIMVNLAQYLNEAHNTCNKSTRSYHHFA